MPFKSESQKKFLFKNHPEIAKRWAAETPKNAKLPEKVSKQRGYLIQPIKPIKPIKY